MTNWPIKKLGELISFEKGKKMTTADDGDPYIGIENLRSGTYSIYTKEKHGLRCIPNDVLLVWDGAYAGTIGMGLEGFVGSTIVKVLHDKSLKNSFLFYLLNFYRSKIRLAAQGAAIPHLSKTFINNLKISLPPLVVQKQIVERLDKIAEAQKLNDGLIQKSDELFQSLLHKELNPAGRDWEIKKLGDVCEKTEQAHPSKFFKESFHYIDISSINGEEKTIQAFSTCSVKQAPSRARKLVMKNDILFATTRPYLENIAMVPDIFDDFIASTGFCVIRANPKYTVSDFLFFNVISKPFIKKVLPFQRGANYPAVSDKNIYGIKIHFPPLKKQKQIVAKLSAVQDYKTQLLAQKSKLKEFFDSVLNKSFKRELVK